LSRDEDETMLIIAVAWLYVAGLMAFAEASHVDGSLLGAFFTFVLYGLLPTGLVLYVGSTRLRRRIRAVTEAREAAAPSSGPAPDAGGHAPGIAVAPEREEP
jgi:hypothetical protein